MLAFGGIGVQARWLICSGRWRGRLTWSRRRGRVQQVLRKWYGVLGSGLLNVPVEILSGGSFGHGYSADLVAGLEVAAGRGAGGGGVVRSEDGAVMPRMESGWTARSGFVAGACGGVSGVFDMVMTFRRTKRIKQPMPAATAKNDQLLRR